MRGCSGHVMTYLTPQTAGESAQLYKGRTCTYEAYSDSGGGPVGGGGFDFRAPTSWRGVG